jgi:hypothetical protein
MRSGSRGVRRVWSDRHSQLARRRRCRGVLLWLRQRSNLRRLQTRFHRPRFGRLFLLPRPLHGGSGRRRLRRSDTRLGRRSCGRGRARCTRSDRGAGWGGVAARGTWVCRCRLRSTRAWWRCRGRSGWWWRWWRRLVRLRFLQMFAGVASVGAVGDQALCQLLKFCRGQRLARRRRYSRQVRIAPRFSGREILCIWRRRRVRIVGADPFPVAIGRDWVAAGDPQQ